MAKSSSFSAIWAVLFLAVGAGAVLQVVYTILRSMMRNVSTPLFSPVTVAGFLGGLVVMYATGFLAAAERVGPCRYAFDPG